MTGLTGGIEHLFKKYKVDYKKGKGKITGANSVEVTGETNETLATKNIVIATGSEPSKLPMATVDNAGGKIVDGVVKLSSQDTEMYVTKFSFSPSVLSTINGTFHTDEREYFDNHPHSLTLCLYDDVAWPKFQTACAATACGTVCTRACA